jgi:hypothetical protein
VERPWHARGVCRGRQSRRSTLGTLEIKRVAAPSRHPINRSSIFDGGASRRHGAFVRT